MSDVLIDYDVRVPLQTEYASNPCVEVVSEIGTTSCVHYNIIVPVHVAVDAVCDEATRLGLGYALGEP